MRRNEEKNPFPGKDWEKIRVIRSARRTMSLEIRPDGSLLVRGPYTSSTDEILNIVRKNQAWIERQRKVLQEKRQNRKESDLKPLTREDIQRLADQALRELPPRIASYARQMGVAYGRVTIRNQRTRWGSCSSRGNLNFNCLLMLTPVEVQDYVIVHELCHRKEMNHGPRFWAEVEKILPDYKKSRQWLRENGGVLIQRMTAGLNGESV